MRMASPGQPPAFLIIGAQKAATTTLRRMLSRHPQIESARIKEVGHFSRDVHFGASLADYQEHFKPLPWKRPIFFEATPEYLAWPGVAGRIASAYPDIKLIAVLREPVSRAYSAWNMYGNMWKKGTLQDILQKGKLIAGNRLPLLMEGREEIRPFRECLEIERSLIENAEAFEPALIRRGLYLAQLQEYWQHFPRERLLIIGFSALKAEPQGILDRVCAFLGLPRFELDAPPPKANEGDYATTIDDADRAFLEEIYTAPNRALFDEIGPVDW